MALNKEEHDLVIDCLSFLETHEEQLTQFEVDFLTGKGPGDKYDSLQEKYEKYGQDIKLSEKQIGVLRRMYDKIINGVKPEFRRR